MEWIIKIEKNKRIVVNFNPVIGYLNFKGQYKTKNNNVWNNFIEEYVDKKKTNIEKILLTIDSIKLKLNESIEQYEIIANYFKSIEEDGLRIEKESE